MIYFMADPHFGCHKLVENTRPMFDSVEQHDEALIDEINLTVRRDDTLVIAGDFCREKPGRYRQQIKCRHTFFILGNHDKPGKIKAVFGGNVWQYKTVRLPHGERVFVCHYCMAAWDQSHYGATHVYGHWHGSKEALMDSIWPQRRSMDVGVDNAFRIFGTYRPFSADEILDCLAGRVGHDFIPPEERWFNEESD